MDPWRARRSNHGFSSAVLFGNHLACPATLSLRTADEIMKPVSTADLGEILKGCSDQVLRFQSVWFYLYLQDGVADRDRVR